MSNPKPHFEEKLPMQADDTQNRSKHFEQVNERRSETSDNDFKRQQNQILDDLYVLDGKKTGEIGERLENILAERAILMSEFRKINQAKKHRLKELGYAEPEEIDAQFNTIKASIEEIHSRFKAINDARAQELGYENEKELFHSGHEFNQRDWALISASMNISCALSYYPDTESLAERTDSVFELYPYFKALLLAPTLTKFGLSLRKILKTDIGSALIEQELLTDEERHMLLDCFKSLLEVETLREQKQYNDKIFIRFEDAELDLTADEKLTRLIKEDEEIIPFAKLQTEKLINIWHTLGKMLESDKLDEANQTKTKNLHDKLEVLFGGPKRFRIATKDNPSRIRVALAENSDESAEQEELLEKAERRYLQRAP